MVPVPIVGKAWTASDASRGLFARLERARIDAGLTRKQYCGKLVISESRLSEMESGADAGPGILRFASMPLGFWISMLKSTVADAIGRAVGEADLRYLIDLVQVWLLERQLSFRMAKAELPADAEERRTA